MFKTDVKGYFNCIIHLCYKPQILSYTMVQYNRVEQPTRHIVGYFWDNLMSQMIQLPVS